MSIAQVQSGHFLVRALGPIAVTPCRPAPRCEREGCDPEGPIPFGEFLEARNKAAREAEADAPRLLGNLDRGRRPEGCPDPCPERPEERSSWPRLGEVLPVEPAPREAAIVHRHVRTMEVLTGNIIDVVM